MSRSCPTVSSSNALSEPSCEVVSKAQKLQGEAERSWALSQACAYYQHRCPPGEVDTESCIRIMGESCSARVLQCSLLNTMQNLEPAMQTHAQGEGRHLFTDAEAWDSFALLHFSPSLPLLCPSSSVWSEITRSAKHYTASLQDCWRLSCASRQLALASKPAAGRWPDVRGGSGGQLLGGHCCTLFCWVSVRFWIFSIETQIR